MKPVAYRITQNRSSGQALCVVGIKSKNIAGAGSSDSI